MLIAPAMLVAVLCFAPSLPAQEDATLAITGVHVVDVEQGRILRDQTVLVEGKRITGIGPSAGCKVPVGARTIEGQGRYLLPGLIDTHVHFNGLDDEDHLWLYLANGVTTVHSMHGGEHQLELRARVDAGELPGPRILTTGPTTSSLGIHTPAQARAMVEDQKAAGYDAIKQYGDGSDTMSRETYHELIDAAHEAGLRVMGHAPRNLPFSAVLAEGQDSIDHMEEIVYTSAELAGVVEPYVQLQFGGRPLAGAPETKEAVPDFVALLEDELQALARAVHDAGLTVTPTLVTFGTIQDITDDDLFSLLEREELCYVHPSRRLTWSPDRIRFRNGGWAQELEFVSAYLRRNHELQMALTGAFHRAGVPILAGTDSPFDLVVEGFALHDELELLQRAGLEPLEALRSATIRPARFLGLDAGNIEIGRRADLVLVDGDPLADLSAARRVAGVCAAGRWWTRSKLQERLDALADRYRALAPRVEELAILLEADRFEEAVKLYRTADASDTSLARFMETEMNDLGYRLLRSKRTEQAVAVFERNTELFPDAANAWDSLGEGYYELGQRVEAVEAYERALELVPGDAGVLGKIERILDSF